MTKAVRPFERRVIHLEDSGMDIDEIGRRFGRSGDHIRRVIDLANLPGRSHASSDRDGLRAIERRVLHWRRKGVDHDEIGRRFKRTAGSIRQIEGLARIKQGRELLSREPA